MNCPYCNHFVSDGKRRCTGCGQDIVIYRKLYRLSNQYYNKGLERAKVRDLSGAVIMLKKSLELDKRNTNARNLLGLVLYEMGEVVTALSEWILSKHFQPEENMADYYMESLQSNPTNFDNLNQTIKKYNLALQAAKQGNTDLAIIQLKKVVSANPHYVRALQLLALLYMKSGENEKARRCLIKASKVDVANVITLTYLEEIKQATAGSSSQTEQKMDTEESVPQPIAPMDSYREDKPNYIAFIAFFAGIIIGISVLYALVIPNVKSNITNAYNEKERDYASVISVHTATISSLESERDALKKQIEELKKQAENYVEYDTEQYTELLAVAAEYPDYLERLLLAVEEETLMDELDSFESFAKQLNTMELRFAENKAAMQIYETMKSRVCTVLADACYDYGHTIYNNGDYEEALPYLEMAYEYRKEHSETLYFLARTYHRLNQYDKAIPIYTALIENYPDSKRYADAVKFLDAIKE